MKKLLIILVDIYDENGSLKFVEYSQWLIDNQRKRDEESLRDFYKTISDNSIANSVEKYVSDLMKGVKDALGITADTEDVEKQIQNYLNIFGGQGPAASIATFIDDIIHESALGRAISGAITTVKDFFGGIADGITNFFTGHNWDYYFGKDGQGFGELLKNTFTGIVDDIKQGAPKLAGLVSNLFGIGDFTSWKNSSGKTIYSIIGKDGIRFATENIGEIWKTIGSTISSNVAGAVGSVIGLFDGILENWDFTSDLDLTTWGGIGQALVNFGQQALNRVVSGITGLISGKEYQVLSDGTIQKKIDGEWQTVENGIREVIGDLTSSISTFFTEKFPNFFNDNVNNFLFGGNGENPSKFFVQGDILGSFGNLGRDLLGRALNGLTNLLNGPDGQYQIFDDNFGENLSTIWQNTKNSIIDKLVGDPNLYRYDFDRNQLQRLTNGEWEDAGIANVIGDVINNIVPNINSIIGNTVNALTKKDFRYGIRDGKLVKLGLDGNLLDEQWASDNLQDIYQEFWSEIGDSIKGGVSDLLSTGLDKVADIFETDHFRFMDGKWWEVKLDSHGDIYDKVESNWANALKNFLGEGSSGFIDKIEEVVDNIFGKDNPDSLVNKITNLPNTLQGWLKDQIGGDWNFDLEKGWTKGKEQKQLSDALAEFGAQTLTNMLDSVMPVLSGLLGFGEDIEASTGGLWAAATNKFQEKAHEWGLSIAEALVPDDLKGWLKDKFGEDSGFGLFDGVITGLKTNLADIIDNLIGDNLNPAKNKAMKGSSFGDIISTLFTPEGSKGLGETVGSAIKNTLGGIGENILEFFSKGGEYEYVPGKGFYNKNAPKDKITREYTGEGRSLGGVLRDIALDTFAPEGYHAYNGRYYNEVNGEWNPTTGTPSDQGTGSGGTSPVATTIAGIISGLTGQTYTPVGNFIYGQDAFENGVLKKDATPISLLDALIPGFSETFENIGGVVSGIQSGMHIAGGLPAAFNAAFSNIGQVLMGGYSYIDPKTGQVSFFDKDGVQYGINPETGKIDYNNILNQPESTSESTPELTPTKQAQAALENYQKSFGSGYEQGFIDWAKQQSSMYKDLDEQLLRDIYNGITETTEDAAETAEDVAENASEAADEAAAAAENTADAANATNDIAEGTSEVVNQVTDEGIVKEKEAIDESRFSADSISLGGGKPWNMVTANLSPEKETIGEENTEVTIPDSSADIKKITGLVENIDDNVTTSTELAEDAANTDINANGTKSSNVTTDEEGNLIDAETGEPIDMPYNAPTQTTGGGGSTYTPDTGGGGDFGGGGGSGGSSGGGGSSGTGTTGLAPSSIGQSISNFVVNNANNGKYAGNGVTIGGQNYDYVKDNDGGVIGFTDPSTGQSYDLSGNLIIGENAEYATGQNNTRILQFASGKEGHMAITGELGPELTIREDGSVDMLGRNGREYAWVNPGDIIYTAAQTTSILGNNNITWLDEFAKGFNNKIRAYGLGDGLREAAGNLNPSGDTWTPGNTWGGSSGGISSAVRSGAYEGTRAGTIAGAAAAAEDDPRYDMYTLKERDIVTRYFTILQQIDDITREVEHFGKAADRAWGEEKIQAIQRQTDAYKNQLAAYNKYVNEIERYLVSDKNALTRMVEEFAEGFSSKTAAEFFKQNGSLSSGGKSSLSSRFGLNLYGIGNAGDGSMGSYLHLATGQNNRILGHDTAYNADLNITQYLNTFSHITEDTIDSTLKGYFDNFSSSVNSDVGKDRTPIRWTTAEYDANGVLLNYEDIVLRLIEIYNENAEAFAKDKEAQYKFQEMLKDIQFYSDTLNLYEQQKETIQDLKNAILDNQMREIVYRIEYENELDTNALKEINYNFEKIRDNAYYSAEAIDYYATKMGYLDEANERLKDGIKDIFAVYSGNVINGTQKAFSSTAYLFAPLIQYNLEEEAEEEAEELVEEAEEAQETVEEAIEEVEEIADETEEERKAREKKEKEERKKKIKEEEKEKKKEREEKAKEEEKKIKEKEKARKEARKQREKDGEEALTTQEELEEEFADYLENFDKVMIGEQEYLIPKSDDVEIDEDLLMAVDITRPMLNNQGKLTDYQKGDITNQVKAWYEELQENHPEIELDVTPVYDEEGYMTNFRDVVKAINEVNSKLSEEMYNLLLNDTQAFFDIWSEITVENADFQDITTETAKQLENMIDQIYANLQTKEKYVEAVINTLGSDIKTFSKYLNAQVDEFNYYNEVFSNFQDIINLTNRRQSNITSGLINILKEREFTNALNNIIGSRTTYQTLKAMWNQANESYIQADQNLKNYRQSLEELGKTEEEITGDETYRYYERLFDETQEQMDIATSKLEDSHKQFLKSWEDALSKITERYQTAVEEAARTFEESFSPIYNTFELLSTELERQKALEDLYVDNYQRIHDLNALDRSIEQSILDTDNLKSKGRLRELQQEINDLQEQGTELSAYDLDILEKKYQVELARQALEDAKDAKSLVRLARDNNGNWSYVYTANEEDVDEAEQRYENAIRDMEQANQNYIDNLESQITQVQQQASDALRALNPSDYTDYASYAAAVESIVNGAARTADFLGQQLENAFGNNEWLDPYIIDRYGANNHDLTTAWGDMILAALTNYGSTGDLTDNMKDRLNVFANDTLTAYQTIYSEGQDLVAEAAGTSLDTLQEYFNEESEIISEESLARVERTTELADRVGTAFEATAAKVRDFNKDIYDLTLEYEKLNDVLIKFLEISGEYVPEEKLDFTSKIDSWVEFDEIRRVLSEYGKLIVTDYDEEGNRRIYELEEGTQETEDLLAYWIEEINKVNAIDIGEDLDLQSEYDQINAYLEKYGEVYISIDGELKKLSKDNRDDMEWLEVKLEQIEKASKAKSSDGSSWDFDFNFDFGNGHVSFSGSSGGNSSDDYYYWDKNNVKQTGSVDQATSDYNQSLYDHYIVRGDTGLYTGRWQGLPYDTGGYTGMYTGEWPDGSTRRNGRLAWLHQKELVLNAHDTENFLDAMNIVRQLDNLTSWMANGLGDLFSPHVTTEKGKLEQQVHIDASFPNVTDHNEIEQAFGNLVNLASQYANRKSFT